MPLTSILFYILPSFLLAPFCKPLQKEPKVLICYAKLKPESISGYHMLILEPKHYLPSNIRVFKKQNEQVFAYLSLGEVNANADHFAKVSKYTLGKNEQWDSHYLNLNSPETLQVLLDLVAHYFAEGYDGLFLDNIDNYAQFGPQKDQKQALIELIRKIKTAFPAKKLIQNAGLELVPDTANYIHSIAIESVATNYDFTAQKYQLSDESRYNSLLASIEQIQNSFHKSILLIEYADDESLKRRVEERLSAVNCALFIGKIDLQQPPLLQLDK